MDLVDVGALGVSVAGILLSSELSVVGILELDHVSFYRFPRRATLLADGRKEGWGE